LITLRDAESSDVAAIAGLLVELDHYYGATDVESAESRIPAVRDAIFGQHPAARVALAWKGPQLVGFAAFSYLWPAAGVTRSLYLKELYVVEECRKEGIGRLLLQYVCRIAIDAGCSRVEWTTDAANPDAQEFYAVLGVPQNRSKLFYRADGDTLRRLATLPIQT
jgi:GNAT superfamily N-acetyltransferase